MKKLLVTRSSENKRRMKDLAIKGVTARLAGLILDLLQDEGVVTREGHYRLGFRYTQEQLSTMIGAKRVAITRAFGMLQESGCVRLFRRLIYIVDLDALRRWAVAG